MTGKHGKTLKQIRDRRWLEKEKKKKFGKESRWKRHNKLNGYELDISPKDLKFNLDYQGFFEFVKGIVREDCGLDVYVDQNVLSFHSLDDWGRDIFSLYGGAVGLYCKDMEFLREKFKKPMKKLERILGNFADSWRDIFLLPNVYVTSGVLGEMQRCGECFENLLNRRGVLNDEERKELSRPVHRIIDSVKDIGYDILRQINKVRGYTGRNAFSRKLVGLLYRKTGILI